MRIFDRLDDILVSCMNLSYGDVRHSERVRTSSFICLPEPVLLKENGVAVGGRAVYVASNQFDLQVIVKCICRCFKCIRLKV
jgi:hypothetical protein